MAKDYVEAAIREGEVMPVAAGYSGRGGVLACQPGVFDTNVQPMDFRFSERREFCE
jgi:hypothetical protein